MQGAEANIDLEVFGRFGLTVTGVVPISDNVLKLETNQDSYRAEIVEKSESELDFTVSVWDQTNARGVLGLPRIRRTLDGKGYAPYGEPLADEEGDITQQYCLVTDWLPGRPCDFSISEDVNAVTRALADLHQKCRAMEIPPASDPRISWDKWQEAFVERTQDLENFKQLASTRSPGTFVDRVFLNHFDAFSREAHAATEFFTSQAFLDLADQSRRELTLTHHRVSAADFVISDGEACIIWLGQAHLGPQILDLSKVMVAGLRKAGWSLTRADELLSHYQSVEPLEPAEFQAILAFLRFPQKFWRVASRYYLSKGPWTEEEALTRLQAAVRKETARDSFLAAFEARYCK